MWSIYDLQLLPISFLVLAILSIALHFVLKNKALKLRLIPFKLIAVFIVVIETGKQIRGITYAGGYNNIWLPFHVCSIFIFSFPLAVFLKQGSKGANIFWALSFINSFMVTVSTLIVPSLIMGEQIRRVLTGTSTLLFMDIHSIAYHLAAILFLMFIIALKPIKMESFSLRRKNNGTSFENNAPERKNNYSSISGYQTVVAVIIFMSFVALAWIMAIILQRNFSAFRLIGNTIGIQSVIFVLYLIAVVVSAAILMYVPKLFKKICLRKVNPKP